MLTELFTAFFVLRCFNVTAASVSMRQPLSRISPKPVVFFLTFPVIKNITRNQKPQRVFF